MDFHANFIYVMLIDAKNRTYWFPMFGNTNVTDAEHILYF
jgi:hypothetical protein